MKILSFTIALIATIEIQSTNPCLCEYFLARRIQGDS